MRDPDRLVADSSMYEYDTVLYCSRQGNHGMRLLLLYCTRNFTEAQPSSLRFVMTLDLLWTSCTLTNFIYGLYETILPSTRC